ncbi:glycolipid transfer protein [Brevipalpus obovatus]|uniref:glycolipid transfer protein n=1 Tax=Brevipalpus obovatus TaxID=246614 RepID=UPI003D9ED2AD
MAETESQIFHYRLFPVCEKDKPIELLPFLEASTSLVEFISTFGTVFMAVRLDMNGNIATLHSTRKDERFKFVTVEDVIEYHLVNQVAEPKTELNALIWLNRALEYVHQFLQLYIKDHEKGVKNENLTPLLTEAYQKTLRQYHNFIVQNLVFLCLKAAPSRKKLFTPLFERVDLKGIGDDCEFEREEQLLREIKLYASHLNEIISKINLLLKKLE